MRSLAIVGGALARLIETRMLLFVAEFQLERMRLIRCLVLAILGATLLGTAFLVATTLIFLSVAEEHQSLVLGITLLFLLGTAAACIGFSLHYIFGGQTPFKATTDALKEDGECLISQIKK